MKRILALAFLVAVPIAAAAEFSEVSFATKDGRQVYANLYGDGDHAVVLAHGAVFDKESWHAQALALKERGLQVLAIDFRGYGKSRKGKRSNGKPLDILAAVDYLKGSGAEKVSVLGGSMGGAAAAEASTVAAAGAIDKLVLLAHPPISSPKKMQGDKLFVVSEGDGLLKSVQSQFDKATDPKRLEVLPGSAHAQHIFKTAQAGPLTDLILDFLDD